MGVPHAILVAASVVVASASGANAAAEAKVVLNETLLVPTAAAVAGEQLTVHVRDVRGGYWNASGLGGRLVLLADFRDCGAGVFAEELLGNETALLASASLLLPDFGFRYSAGHHGASGWTAVVRRVPAAFVGRRLHACLAVGGGDAGVAVYLTSERSVFVFGSRPWYSVVGDGGGDEGLFALAGDATTLRIRGFGGRDTPGADAGRLVVALVPVADGDASYETWAGATVDARLLRPGLLPCLALGDGYTSADSPAALLLRNVTAVPSASSAAVVDVTFSAADFFDRTGGYVAVCVSTDYGAGYAAVSKAAVDQADDVHGFGRRLAAEPGWPLPLVVHADLLNVSGGGVRPSVRCTDPMIAGDAAVCSLHLAGSLRNESAYNVSAAAAAGDYSVLSLRDGSGQELCPLPQPRYLPAEDAVAFAFTPQRAGSLGSIRLAYRGVPIPLSLDAAGHDLGSILPPGVLGSPSVRGLNDTVLRGGWGAKAFVVLEPGGSDDTLAHVPSSPSSGDDAEWTNTTGARWEPDLHGRVWGVPPMGASGLFAPEPGAVSQHERTFALEAAAAAGDAEVSVQVFYFLHLAPAASGFLSSDATRDGVVTVTYTTTDGGAHVASFAVYHTGSRQRVDVVGFEIDATTGAAAATAATVYSAAPSRAWEVEAHSAPRPAPARLASVKVTFEADTRRGATLLFSHVAVRQTRVGDEEVWRARVREADALRALYSALGGGGWEASERWLAGSPCGDAWQGVTCRDRRVTEVSLPSNSLEGDVSSVDFAALPLLQVLDLSGNAVSGRVSNLTDAVRVLRLGRNRLSGLAPHRLPLCSEVVDLSGNALASLPGGVLRTSGGAAAAEEAALLRTADFSRNVMHRAAGAEGGEEGCLAAGALQTLSFAHNRLQGALFPACNETDAAESVWSSTLLRRRRHNLRSLDVSHNLFSSGLPESYARFAGLGLLSAQHNLLSGTIPQAYEAFLQAGVRPAVLLSNNLLEGTVPAWTARAGAVDLRGNGLSCALPRAPPLSFVGGEAHAYPGSCTVLP